MMNGYWLPDGPDGRRVPVRIIELVWMEDGCLGERVGALENVFAEYQPDGSYKMTNTKVVHFSEIEIDCDDTPLRFEFAGTDTGNPIPGYPYPN